MEWEDIQYAPRNGEEILLYIPRPDIQLGMNYIINGWWFESPKEIDDGWETSIGFIGTPTHWMPLPDLPSK